jgi:spore maturation protein CgeB
VRLVFLGLSITSSWGNGHATNYRGLLRALDERGHDVLFLERDVPWYAAARDLTSPSFCRTELYGSLEELFDRFTDEVAGADAVVIGSYVPDGVGVAEWVLGTATGTTAFYDLDTPVTLDRLDRGDVDYLAPELVPRFDLYLSFTGGPTLDRLTAEYGAARPRAFHCIAEPSLYFPEQREPRWTIGYLGTYSFDRQPALERLLLEPARRLPGRRFAVVGPQYPPELSWPTNVEHIEHLPPSEHRRFYTSQAFTLSVTRRDMVEAGWSPSVRLFEAAACAVPVITDAWPGLESFFVPGREILVAATTKGVLEIIAGIDEDERRAIGARARRRVLEEHTADHRAGELERYLFELAAVGA